jgi:hypothetical protein
LSIFSSFSSYKIGISNSAESNIINFLFLYFSNSGYLTFKPSILILFPDDNLIIDILNKINDIHLLLLLITSIFNA